MRTIAIGICTMVLIAGCGKQVVSPTAVEGTVHFLGRPLSGGVIVLTPDRERGTSGKILAAEIDRDGRYRMPDQGVTPGWYRVSISDLASWNAVEGFPAELRNPARSGLCREVVVGGTQRLDFLIEAR